MKQKILQELQKPEFPDLKFIFSAEALEHALELLEELLETEKQDFQKLLSTIDKDITFDTFQIFSYLDYYFSLLYHYKSVSSTTQMRKIIEDFEPKYNDFCHEVSYSVRYYNMHRICLNNGGLDAEQHRSITTTLQHFETRGIALDSDKQEQLKNINKQLSELSMQFSNNEVDSENEIAFVVKNEEYLSSMPQADKLSAQKRAEDTGCGGYLFDASMASYGSLMKYCSDAETRKEFYHLYMQIASHGEYDNTQNVLDIISARQQKAHLLGYASYAELGLVYKMAESDSQVIELIQQVAQKSKIKATDELENFKKYFGLSDIFPWDIPYYSRIYKQEKYSFDDTLLKPYFEFNSVLQGLFDICQTLFGIEVRESSNENHMKAGYHSDVIFREIYKDGKLLSYFVGDYFYRPKKDSGAWNNNLRDKHQDIHTFMVNVGSFEKNPDGPTLLYLRDVETIFHEFGHALHHILSQDRYESLGRDVEWDFVELPSQLMENWCRDPEVLSRFAHHNETGENIPNDMIDALEALEKYGTGLQYTGYHYLELFDMAVHGSNIPTNKTELQQLFLDLAHEYGVFQREPSFARYNSFSHVFAGGYAVGFYSYMWAEILETQVLEHFKKHGMMNPETGQKYLHTILSQGSIKPAMELFRDFTGEEMNVSAFLERKGF